MTRTNHAQCAFVGVALDTPAQVFEAIGRGCGPYLKRVPDGEPGGRRLWIIPLKRADGASAGRVHFGELGYAREARPSYEDFVEARRAGHIRRLVGGLWNTVTSNHRQKDSLPG